MIQDRLKRFKINDPFADNFVREKVCESCLNDMGIRFTK